MEHKFFGMHQLGDLINSIVVRLLTDHIQRDRTKISTERIPNKSFTSYIHELNSIIVVMTLKRINFNRMKFYKWYNEKIESAGNVVKMVLIQTKWKH